MSIQTCAVHSAWLPSSLFDAVLVQHYGLRNGCESEVTGKDELKMMNSWNTDPKGRQNSASRGGRFSDSWEAGVKTCEGVHGMG